MDDNNGFGDGDVGDGDGPNGNVRTNRSREKIWWKSVKRIQSHTATDCVFVGVPQTEESPFPTFCKTFFEKFRNQDRPSMYYGYNFYLNFGSVLH